MSDSFQSWCPEVIADSSGKWSRNQMRFATKEEADAYNADLMWRWTSVREIRSVEHTDPVNAIWHADRSGWDRVEHLPTAPAKAAE